MLVGRRDCPGGRRKGGFAHIAVVVSCQGGRTVEAIVETKCRNLQNDSTKSVGRPHYLAPEER